MEHEPLLPFFYEIFDASLPRLGPGDDTATARALAKALEGRPNSPLRVLDLGCGNGAQTLCLAALVEGTILAVDNHEPYLVELRRRAAAAGMQDRIRAVVGDMVAPEPGPELFDLIWSEGAIFVPGVEEALTAWRPLLAPGGRLAFTELCWFEADPPAECAQFFGDEYPAIASVAEVLSVVAGCGYAVVDHFSLPDAAWRDAYYRPLAARLAELRARPGLGAHEQELIAATEREIEIFDRHSRWYGYEFFVLEPGT